MKTSNSVSLRTSFQTLLYSHIEILKNLNSEDVTIKPVVATQIIENSSIFAQEIIDNGERIWLEDFRWYKDKLDVGKPPKSSILWMLFCVESFIKCHWEVACKVIQTKEKTESFLDEYGTRWISYSDLIMSMEEEFSFLEHAINAIYDDPLIKKDRQTKEFIPKYSILRMMWRIWGKYVMKRVIPTFIDKIKNVLSSYHEKILEFAQNFSEYSNNKSLNMIVKNRWSLDMIMRELIIQSVQMIIDISLNEISIHYIDSSEATFSNFYTQVEKVILDSAQNLYEEIGEYTNPFAYRMITEAHFKEIKGIFPKCTQRKLQELSVAKSVEQVEKRIMKTYTEFISTENDEDSKQSYSALKEANSMWKRQSKLTHPDFFKLIFGEQEQQRIFTSIKVVVKEHDTGRLVRMDDSSDMESVSDDEEEEESKEDTQYRNVSFEQLLWDCMYWNFWKIWRGKLVRWPRIFWIGWILSK